MSASLTWHIRQASLEDFNRANLIFEFLSLGRKLLAAISEDIPTQFPTLRKLPQDEDQLFNLNFESFLYEEYPKEFLNQLHEEVLGLHRHCLALLIQNKVPESDIFNIAREHGTQFSKRRWRNLPDELADDFTGFTLLFQQTPVYWLFPGLPPIVIRSIQKELILEYRLNDITLAKTYAEWLFGAFLAFQKDLKLEMIDPEKLRFRYFRSDNLL